MLCAGTATCSAKVPSYFPESIEIEGEANCLPDAPACSWIIG